ncbi:putative sensor domain DACNV-containing protein [Lentzea terrae]|uniref:putative sensor domain DACNV-containing protein n=1 Tax=Lentzea terrae TaxID=2200761 RepID=UPI0013005E00|nr:hypothetical protein [Lentzea terrae]
MSVYPAALAVQVRKSWRKSFFRADKAVPLPDKNTLNKLLDVAFQASLTYDERRPTRFQVIFVDSTYMDRRSDHHNYLTPIRKSVKFGACLPFDAAHVRRLAPATDPSQTMIGVERHSEEDGVDSLRIWGLLDVGSSWVNFMRHEKSGGSPPPNALTITSNEPGHIAVSHGGDVVATLRAGEIILPGGDALYAGPIGEFLDPARSSCYSAVCDRLGIERFSETDDGWPRRCYTIVLERILLGMESRGHGGTLLMIPHEWNDVAHPWNTVVSTKYRISDDRIWQIMIDDLVLHKEYFGANSNLWNSKENIRVSDYRNVKVLSSKRDGVSEVMGDAIRFAASLCGVDGAIVMTDRFEIVGFGAEVTASAPVMRTISICDDAEGRSAHSVSVESFGTRHRAAFRFAWSLPQVIAFVASEDGGIRAVRRVGDGVLTWPEVTARWMYL